jgi:hypothetical protein
MLKKLLVALVLFSLVATSARTFTGSGKVITWTISNPNRVGGFSPVILGDPAIKIEGKDSSIYFNGTSDGLMIPTIPVEGWQKFTIEVLFKPDTDGGRAPRFIHFEDTAFNRGTFELRVTSDGQWYFDGFLKNGKTNKGLTLIDSTRLHPANKWFWAAIVYDGKKMYSYINGQRELEGEIDFPPMTKGNISLGVRLNKVNWFKGQIREIRFHPQPLDEKKLQQYRF